MPSEVAQPQHAVNGKPLQPAVEDAPQPQENAAARAETERLVLAAWTARDEAKWQEAVDLAVQVRERAPAEIAGWMVGIYALRMCGRLDEAEALCPEARQRFPDDAWPFTEPGWIAQQRGDQEKVVAAAAPLRERFPQDLSGWLLGISGLRALGRIDEATALLRRAEERFAGEMLLLAESAWLAHAHADWEVAIARAADLRERFPQDLGGWLVGISGLRALRRFDEATALLSRAQERFAGDKLLLAEAAWLAHAQADWEVAIARAADLRERFPQDLGGWLVGISGLRALGRFDEATALLSRAEELFAGDMVLLAEAARLAQAQADWDGAIARAADLRERFPQDLGGWLVGISGLRALGRFDEATALLSRAEERFAGDMLLLVEAAWLAQAQAHWEVAIARAAELRERFPEQPSGWMVGHLSLRGRGRIEEADAVLREAAAAFPGQAWPLAEGARLALSRARWNEAAARAAQLRQRLPTDRYGWVLGAQALCAATRFDEAEALLRDLQDHHQLDVEATVELARIAENRADWEEADRHWACAESLAPEDPGIALRRALLAVAPFHERNKDWDKSFARLEQLHSRFPDWAEGYAAHIDLLRQAERFAEAGAVADRAASRLPDEPAIAAEAARVAEDTGKLPEAITQFAAIAERFPSFFPAPLHLARALAKAGHYEEADRVCDGARARFPDRPQVWSRWARIAVQRKDWEEAVRRWREAEDRFPAVREIRRGGFEARLALTGDSKAGVTAERPWSGSIGRSSGAVPAAAELMAQFESLGGTGQGCEFGIVQRLFGAEPLGLLRWSMMAVDRLIDALESRFEGVGTLGQTMLREYPSGPGLPPEYLLRDRRFVMLTHTFVKTDEVAFETMFAQSCRRLQFLKRKLIEDLEAGEKIFVYKIAERNLTDTELDRLHRAIRAYGSGTLLYVRYADQHHPRGTAESRGPGLIVGYISHFNVDRFDEPRTPALAEWQSICGRAFELARSAPGDTPDLASTNTVDRPGC